VTRVPLVATTPDHAQLPLAVHDVASVLDQVIVELAPEEIVEGLNAITAVGVGVAASTLRVPTPITPMASSSGHRIERHAWRLTLIRQTAARASCAPSEKPAQCTDPCNYFHLTLHSDDLCNHLKTASHPQASSYLLRRLTCIITIAVTYLLRSGICIAVGGASRTAANMSYAGSTPKAGKNNPIVSNAIETQPTGQKASISKTRRT